MHGIAELLFTKYVFAFEVTSALLITAAVGAMVLAHIEREPGQQRSQKALARGPASARHGRSRCPARASSPAATRSARPALLPDGTIAERVGTAELQRSTDARPTAARAGTPDDALGTSTRTPDEPEARPMTPTYYLVLAAILFTIGAVGVLVRRNAIVVFMCVELMLNAVNLTLVTFARDQRHPRRPDHGVLRHGRRRRRGRGRPRDHHVDLPDPPVGVGRRRQPAEVLSGPSDTA